MPRNKRLAPGEFGKIEVAIIRALLAGHTTAPAIAAAENYAVGTISDAIATVYKKTGADSLAHVCLMIGGVTACPTNLRMVVERIRGGTT